MPKATHYEILKVGSEPNKRFLRLHKSEGFFLHWTSQGYAHKFFDLANAVKEQRQHENSYIIWVGVHADGQKGWGEVNRDHIARTY